MSEHLYVLNAFVGQNKLFVREFMCIFSFVYFLYGRAICFPFILFIL